MKRATDWALAFAVALSCLVYDPRALGAEPKRVLALLSVVLLLVHRALAKREAPLSQSHAVLLALLGWLALSTRWGGAERFVILANWCALVGLTLGARALGSEGARRLARRSALLVASATSLWLIGSFALGARGFALHAGQGNPNWAGLVLAVAWPLVFPEETGKNSASWRTRALLIAFDVACAAALLLSESRVGWVAALLALALRTVLLQSPRARWQSALAPLALVAGIGLFSALPHAQGAPIPNPTHRTRSERLERSPELDRSALTSLSGRWWIQRIGARAAWQALPLGTGLGGFADAFLVEQGRALSALTPKLASRRFSNATTAHDDWLELACEGGPLALLLFAGAVSSALRSLLPVWPAGAAALVSASVAALGDSPFHQPALVVLVGLVLASEPSSKAVALPRAALRFVDVALLLTTALLLASSTRAWLSTRLASAALEAPPAERLALLERSVRLRPNSAEHVLALGLAYQETEERARARAMLERAVSLSCNVGSLVALGNARVEWGATELALGPFERALALNMGSVRAQVGISEALRELGRFAEAEQHAHVAFELLPGDPRIVTLLDRIRAERLDAELEPLDGEPAIELE